MSAPVTDPTRIRPVDDDTVIAVAVAHPDPDSAGGVLLRLTNDAMSATPAGPPLDVSGLLSPSEALDLAAALAAAASAASGGWQ